MVGDVVEAEVTVVDVIGVTASTTTDWIWFSSKTMVMRLSVWVV